MQADSLSATRTAITAAEVFQIQNKDPRTLRIAGELVLRLWVSAHMRQSATNLCGQATDVLRIPSGVQEVQVPRANASDVRLADRKQPDGNRSEFHNRPLGWRKHILDGPA